MPRIIMLKGLPASGKTTKAKELMEEDRNSVRVNRDLLREMLHYGIWSGKKEKLTRKAQMAVVKEMLANNKNVIIDDTNLGEYHKDRWSNFAKENNSKFEIVEMPFNGLGELIERDKNREKSVGRDVIIQNALRYGYWEPESKVILCDIDGTIADCTHRLEYVKDEDNKDWEAFFDAMDKDEFRSLVWKQVLEEEGNIIIVTARPERYREKTVRWLNEQGIKESSYITLIMRRDGDRRPDDEVKQNILDMIGKQNVKVVYDDRPSVIRMWESNGLKVVDVGPGKEF